MKKILFPIFSLLVLLGSVDAFGQKHLEQWIQECEKDINVDMTVIDNRFKDTRKKDSYVVKITLPNDSPYLAKLSEQYVKEKQNAAYFSDKREGGKTMFDRCTFYVTETDGTESEIVYDLYRSRDGKQVFVTMIKTFDYDNPELKGKRNRYFMGG